MTTLRIALAQLRSTEDEASNLQTIELLAAEAANHGTQLFATPENATWLRTANRDVQGAPLANHPAATFAARLASLHHMHVLVGSALIRDDPDRLPTNSSLVFAPDGRLLARYDKIHLFQVDLGPSTRLDETAWVRAGQTPVTIDVEGVRLGLSICYDVRFPELYRRLTAQGAMALLVPSAFTERTGRDHWHPLLIARAIENQAYVLAPAQWGDHGNGRVSYGRSLAIDPWGTVLATAPDGVGVMYVDLDTERVDRVRAALPALQHRALANC